MHISTLGKLARSIRVLRKKEFIRNFLYASEVTRGFNSKFEISFSQGGEDLALLSIMNKTEMGSYIDIGAHHPSRFSNTRHLYERGWRGVNIDADEELLASFLTERPLDINICAAIGCQKSYVLNVFDEKLVSTVNKEKIDFEISIGRKIISERKVEGIPLRKILDQYFPSTRVTFISIDIEGSDFDALMSINFDTLEKHRFPEYLVLETFPPLENALNTPAVKLAMSKGYQVLNVLPLSTILKAPIPR